MPHSGRYRWKTYGVPGLLFCSMKSAVLRLAIPTDWDFLEEVAVLCLTFAQQAGPWVDCEAWMVKLIPEAPAFRRKAALAAVQQLFDKGYAEVLRAWVLEDRVPRWSRGQRQQVLQTLTDWAAACGAPVEQLRILFSLEQMTLRRRREADRYGDRPPR